MNKSHQPASAAVRQPRRLPIPYFRDRTRPAHVIRHIDRPTEDDLAQAALGGPKGSLELTPAPLTKAEREQNSLYGEPGHVA